jgi:glycosyltransferase involved in cell wall biosynthesis
VLPSLIEGFGLPVLEAMARDVPVACSNRPALPEVAGDAALLFEPEDQAAVTAAIRQLLDDRELAGRLVELGRARVDLFTWRRTAEATLATYRRAVNESAASARS